MKVSLLNEPGSESGAREHDGEDGSGEELPDQGRPDFEGYRRPLGPQGKTTLADRIFTTVKGSFLRAFFGSVAAALAVPALALAAQPRVLAIHFDLEVNPVTSSYLDHQLDRAPDDDYDAAAIVLDTPGGLSESMRKIVKHELASTIPVIVYVSPPGARAASAGVWIGQAADELAMAPGTNIGSSTPISSSGQNIDSDLRRKVINDARASLRSLAKYRGRNVQWADLAVRKASNLTAGEALRMNVIDDISLSLPALLRKIDGRKAAGSGYVFHTAGARIDQVHPGFFTRLLNALIDPNLIPLLFLAGIAGIGYEIFHPGVVLPGALGGISLLTALFGFAVLPISWTGLALLILGAALLVIDAHVTSHGTLTVSGLISIVVGSLMLFHNAPAPYDNVNEPLLIAFAVGLGGIWAFALTKAVQVGRQPVSVGPQTIVGEVGEARRDDMVFVHGELWRARPASGGPLRPGQRIRVAGVDPGLVLEVEEISD
jgi:membrane-bound serine protease (ClpP class)